MYVRALAGAEKIRHWFIAFSHLIIKISLSVLKTFEPFAPHNYLVCSTSYLKICRSSHRSWEQRQSAGLLFLNWSWRFFLDKLIRLLVRFSKMYHYFYSQDIGYLKPKRFSEHHFTSELWAPECHCFLSHECHLLFTKKLSGIRIITHGEHVHLQMASLFSLSAVGLRLDVIICPVIRFHNENRHVCMHVCKGPISTEFFNPHSTHFDLTDPNPLPFFPTPYYLGINIGHSCQ